MNILQISGSDLVGHIFNGYDLNAELIKMGEQANQLVLDKRSDSKYVQQIRIDVILHQQLKALEKQYSVRNILFPYAEQIEKNELFRNADIVHYHMIHKGILSLFDFPRLVNSKKTVWTIHDPWIFTGCCIHPLQCQGWVSGCQNCDNYQDDNFGMIMDNANFMWNVKRDVLKQIDPVVVVSTDFMKQYLLTSPMTKHFSKIKVIPFGVDIKKYDLKRKQKAKKELDLDVNKTIIGCRTDPLKVKGNQYVYKALRNIRSGESIQLVSVGTEKIPQYIKEMYSVVELGWVDDEKRMIQFLEACDIFLMPSEAESFGMMAVEAMAAGCAVICFENTVLEEITEAPYCGIAVKYLSDQELGEKIVKLIHQPEEIKKRGQMGHRIVEKKYKFDKYVNRHKQLYESVLEQRCKDGEEIS